MKKQSFEEFEKVYLLTLHRLTNGRSYVPINTLEFGFALPEFSLEHKIEMDRLAKKRKWIELSMEAGLLLNVSLLPAGVIAAEKVMAKTYAEEELLVLQKIHELGSDSWAGVLLGDLQKALPDLTYPLREYLIELEDGKGFIDSPTGETVKASKKGVQFLEGRTNRDSGFSFNINTGHGSPVTFGDQNTIISNTNLNPEFDKALVSLVEIIKASSMPAHEMRLALDDLVDLQKLANVEKSPGIIARATKIIESFKVLAEAAGLAAQIGPYIPHLLSAFRIQS